MKPGFFGAPLIRSNQRIFLNKNADLSPSKLKEMIMKEVRQYAGGSLSHDDVTIMIAEIG